MEPEQIQSLLSAKAYSHPVEELRLLETHISWIILTGPFAYKIKKPVNLGFLDFSSLEKRYHYCHEELRLNQRLSQGIYCAVVAITDKGGMLEIVEQAFDSDSDSDQAQIGVMDYAVKMHQFDDDAVLAMRIEQQNVPTRVWETLADVVARFHVATKKYTDGDYGTPSVIKEALEHNFEQIRPYLGNKEDIHWLGQIDAWSQEVFRCAEKLMNKRKRKGFVRDCHGDLHLGNIIVQGENVIPFDCIEFNDHLRIIDVASEIAFTLMDLECRGLQQSASELLNHYLECSGDYEALALLRFYKVYRALVRAKVSLLRLPLKQRDQLPETVAYADFQHYLKLACRYMEEPNVFLAIMHGVSGSGKSFLAQQVANAFGAIRIRSDVERKRLYGLDRYDSSAAAPKAGIYTEDASNKTFKRLEDLALSILDDGYSCIVDATFLHAERRQNFHNLALHCDVPFIIIDCQTPQEVIVERLRQRRQLGNDPSEADEKVMLQQVEHAEPLDENERNMTITMDAASGFDPQQFRHFLTD